MNYSKIDAYIRQHPNGAYSDFKNELPKVKISDTSFYQRRKKINAGGVPQEAVSQEAAPQEAAPKTSGKRGGASHHINYTLIDKLIKENPKLTYDAFKKDHPNFVISDAMFYNRRRKINGIPVGSSVDTHKGSAKLYMQVALIGGDITSASMGMLNTVLSAINKAYNHRLEIISLSSPNQIEIRECKK